jgi:hypothetical protein
MKTLGLALTLAIALTASALAQQQQKQKPKGMQASKKPPCSEYCPMRHGTPRETTRCMQISSACSRARR